MSTASELEMASQGSLVQLRCCQDGLRLTERDRQIIELVFRYRVLRDDQVQLMLFSPGSASRCQRRLTLLTRHHYLDRLPRTHVNDPALYLLSRTSRNGNRLIRSRFGDHALRVGLRRIGSVHHLLAINDLRVRVERSCLDLGWRLTSWQTSEELLGRLSSARLIPDAYFQIKRVVIGEEKTAGFFVEVEHSVKSIRVVDGKLERYTAFSRSGAYQELFGTRALRVLFLFTDQFFAPGQQRVMQPLDRVRRRALPLIRLSSLTALRDSGPNGVLLAPIWHQSGAEAPLPLFSQSSLGQ